MPPVARIRTEEYSVTGRSGEGPPAVRLSGSAGRRGPAGAGRAASERWAGSAAVERLQRFASSQRLPSFVANTREVAGAPRRHPPRLAPPALAPRAAGNGSDWA